jgi:decaprenylphospho-beta-D-ribofuranose 2-oxidase
MLWKTDRYSGWGRALAAEGQLARPERMSGLSGIIASGAAPAAGSFRSYGDAALNGGGRIVVMSRLDRMLDFDPDKGVLEVEAGARIGDILDALAPRGWMPAVMPGTGFTTVGGAIANDVHGKNHHTAGSFAQHVESLRLIGANGTERSLSPRKEAATFRATAGGLGQTGIIASARLRLAPCPSMFMAVEERRIGGIDEFVAAFEASETPFSVGWIDATATGAALGRGIIEEARFADGTRGAEAAGRARAVPLDAPGFLLSPPVVRLFNRTYLARVPEAGRRRIRPLRDFFFPLDRIRDWNRLYGRRGFHQFQCVLPPDHADAILRAMLQDVGRSGLASPLAVLKRMGPGRAGPMSFPMEGYTLAIDFPNRQGVAELVASLSARTADAGGRVYLAKDSLVSPALAAAMHPELGDWRAVVNRLDPDRRFQTDLVRRLDLRGPA